MPVLCLRGGPHKIFFQEEKRSLEVEDTTVDAETKTGKKELFPIGTRGFYLSRKGPESPRHGEWCEVIAYVGERLLLAFDNPDLARDSAEQEQFYPRVLPRTRASAGLFLKEV